MGSGNLFSSWSRICSGPVHVLLPETGQVALHTGHEDFDALNARLGLSAVELFPFVGNECVFYFDEPLNVGEAIRVYSMLEGIEYAEANNFLGDGTDIDAVKSQGTWHVAVRRAWGDCPSGCIFHEIVFFTVKNSDVERIERAAGDGRDPVR